MDGKQSPRIFAVAVCSQTLVRVLTFERSFWTYQLFGQNVHISRSLTVNFFGDRIVLFSISRYDFNYDRKDDWPKAFSDLHYVKGLVRFFSCESDAIHAFQNSIRLSRLCSDYGSEFTTIYVKTDASTTPSLVIGFSSLHRLLWCPRCIRCFAIALARKYAFDRVKSPVIIIY